MGRVLFSVAHPDYQIDAVSHRCHFKFWHRTEWEHRDRDIYYVSLYFPCLHSVFYIDSAELAKKNLGYVRLDLMNERMNELTVSWLPVISSVDRAEYDSSVQKSVWKGSRHLSVKSCSNHTRPKYDQE